MMRHAESEERLQSIRDHDRPITDEGRSSAREVHMHSPSPLRHHLMLMSQQLVEDTLSRFLLLCVNLSGADAG